jgi:peptide-methionine (R)-S-oxide reductase
MIGVEEVCALREPFWSRVSRWAPPTGERHRMNSVSLSFTEQGQALSDILKRGAPEAGPTNLLSSIMVAS